MKRKIMRKIKIAIDFDGVLFDFLTRFFERSPFDTCLIYEYNINNCLLHYGYDEELLKSHWNYLENDKEFYKDCEISQMGHMILSLLVKYKDIIDITIYTKLSPAHKHYKNIMIKEAMKLYCLELTIINDTTKFKVHKDYTPFDIVIEDKTDFIDFEDRHKYLIVQHPYNVNDDVVFLTPESLDEYIEDVHHEIKINS